ncbi:hypothetical protein HAPAU_42040 [Halalkalicoccus paucihalophilus]|uniref:Uncharacterized protein n=1 Tax=Halalkalicoccus paucihalophilus TaxID=1008153 RepID=A0A151A810_9EURY|nr:hypothetical protein [Halalkalicoccus paucihalophilus]KYH23724.1 hypothetical protein HAPAU_42040 [Halalkalicoccus paucihalophilus]
MTALRPQTIGRIARDRFGELAASRRKQNRLAAGITGLGGILLAVDPAAAQLADNTGTLCGTGVDTGYMFIMSMLVLGGIVFGSIQSGFGLINLNSTDENAHRKGKNGVKSGATSFGVIFIPVLVTVFLEVLGVNLASCFIPDINVLGGMIALAAVPTEVLD